MIILRQRLYTVQDKKVINELWNKTKRFRTLPNYRKTTARDAFRLDKFSKEFNHAWNTGDTSKIDWEDFKTLAEHLELPETAKGAKHLIEKYSNPELIERYKSIKAHKAGLGKEYKRYRKLRSKADRLEKSHKKASEDYIKKYWDDLKHRGGKVRPSTKKAEERWGKEIKRRDEFLDKSGDKLKELKDKLNGLYKKENAAGKKFGIKQLELTRKASKEADRINKETKRNKKLHRDTIRRLRKEGYTITYNPKESEHVNIETKTVNLHRGTSTAVALHEKNHPKHAKRVKQDRDKEGFINFGDVFETGMGSNPMAHLADEAGASKGAIAEMRANKHATPSDIEQATKELEACYRTYYHDELGNLPKRIRRRFKY